MSRLDSANRTFSSHRKTRPSIHFGSLGFAGMLAVLFLGVGAPSVYASDASDASNASDAATGDASASKMTKKAGAVDPVIAAIDAFIEKHPPGKKEVGNWRTKLKKPPIFKFDASKTYTWKLETNQGEIRFRLLDDVAPMHVSSTLYLTRLGFFDTLKFHRVIKGFMAQGGDPLGRGTGGPGYRFGGEFDDNVVHDAPGILSMANSGPGTDGSQFFITFKATPHLNNKHTIYGKAESEKSLETIRKIESLAKGRAQGNSKPRERIVIKRATILIE